MKKMVIVVIFFLFCGSLSAQDNRAPDNRKTEDSAAEGKTADTATKTPAAVWPESFQPSEQIGADSQISFPTDI